MRFLVGWVMVNEQRQRHLQEIRSGERPVRRRPRP